MKIILTILLLFSQAFAANKYFSSVSGNDNNAGTLAAPYASITKLNAIMSTLANGDSVLFKRGETFIGNIVISHSSINFGAYSTGSNPVITSMVNVTGWTSVGNNVWISAANSSLGSTVTTVTRDGGLIQLGRTPNTTDTDGGYLRFESHNLRTSITDIQLSTTPSWTGAQMVVRTKHFVTEIRTIASHSSVTLTPSVQFEVEPDNNSGYFFQNSLQTLDVQNEWYYNPSTKKIYIKSSTTPTNIQASTGTDLVTSTNFSTLTFRNLSFIGANGRAFQITGGSGINIQNCYFKYVQRAVFSDNTPSVTVSNNTISNAMGDGIVLNDGSSFVVNNNSIDSTFQWMGMGATGNGFGGYGIKLKGGATVSGNRITHNGYSGIRIDGTNTQVYYNLIDGFCNKQRDGGGIYTVPSATLVTGQVIRDNIIVNGIPGLDGGVGNVQYTYGVYIDNNNSNNTVLRNTCSNVYGGIYLHRGNTNTVYGNTSYNNTLAQLYINSDRAGSQLTTADNIKNNILFAKTGSQLVYYFYTLNNDIRSFGLFDSNYICRPFFEPDNISNSGSIGSGGVIRAYAGVNSYWSLITSWKTNYTPYEAASKKTSKGYDTLRFEYNASQTDSVVNLGTYTWWDAKGTIYKNSLTLHAYQSVVLIRDVLSGTQPPAVTINATGSFTGPGNLTLTANATDPDGTIADVKFYNGATLLSTDNTSPYSYNWANIPAGTYTLAAKATDNTGLITTSNGLIVTITNPRPVVNITSPPSGSTYTAPATVVIAVSATIISGSISKVNYYSGGVWIGTDNTSPYEFTWNSVPAGVYSLTAVGVSSFGDSTTSAAKSITVNSANIPPTVNLTSPAAGSSTNTNYTLTANASDVDGTITQVQFFDNGVLLTTDLTSPFTTNQTLSIGTHTLQAKATDNAGAVSTSAPVIVTVLSPNTFPTVSITSPGSGASYAEPADITIDGSASDADGTIAAVHLYVNGVISGSDASSPYSFTITDVEAGGYNIFLRAIDDDGDSTTSTSINITVIIPHRDVDTLEATATIINPILCAGGSALITISASSGTEPYIGTGDTALTAGVYTFYIEDANGLKDTISNFVVPEPGDLSATATVGTIQKYKGTTTAIINAIGGTEPFSYRLNAGTYQSFNTFVVKAGVWVVSVRDANGCLTTVQFTVTQPKPGNNLIIHSATTYTNL